MSELSFNTYNNSAPRKSAAHPAHEQVCPHCNGPVERVRRRFLDRILSLFSPVQRYRCRAKGWDCDWEGNL